MRSPPRCKRDEPGCDRRCGSRTSLEASAKGSSASRETACRMAPLKALWATAACGCSETCQARIRGLMCPSYAALHRPRVVEPQATTCTPQTACSPTLRAVTLCATDIRAAPRRMQSAGAEGGGPQMSRRRTDGGGLLRRYGYRSAYAATGARCSDVTKGGTKSLALTAPAVAFSMRAMVFQSGRQTPRRQRLTLAPLTPISAPKRSVDLPTSFSQSPIVMVALCKCWTLKSSRPINAQWTIALCPRREVWFCCYAAQIMYAARMANRIRELREQRGWSSDHLATLVGVSGATIRRLELGDTKLTLDWMRTLSEALEIGRAHV